MKNESGFTMIEALCALALLLIFVGAASGLAHNARNVTDTARERSREHFRALQKERIIREAVEGVLIPYWAEESLGLQAAREAIENALFDAGLSISFHFEALQDHGGRIRGVVSRSHRDGREYVHYALFASVPLEREQR